MSGEARVIRTGVVLPTFRPTVDDALSAAGQALAAGVDGLFCYDHLWPMGQPERPALAPFPVLGALAASIAPRDDSVGGPFFGTLIARIGLVPNEVLAGQFLALHHIAPGRVIAGLGTGDRLSEAENRAYGIAFAPVTERRRDMAALAAELRHMGVAVWMAAGVGLQTSDVRAVGASMIVWGASPEAVSARATEQDPVPLVWAGPPPKSDAGLRETVQQVTAAGADWVVFGWPVNPEALVEAAHASASSRRSPSAP